MKSIEDRVYNNCHRNCDVCIRKERGWGGESRLIDFSSQLELIITSLRQKNLTSIKLIDALRGRSRSEYLHLGCFGVMKDFSDSICQEMILRALKEGYLTEKTIGTRNKKHGSFERLIPGQKNSFEGFFIETTLVEPPTWGIGSSFNIISLIANFQKNESSLFNKLEVSLRNLRQSFFTQNILSEPRLSALFKERGFTVETILPELNIKNLLRAQPKTYADLRKVILLPKEFIGLEEMILKVFKGQDGDHIKERESLEEDQISEVARETSSLFEQRTKKMNVKSISSSFEL